MRDAIPGMVVLRVLHIVNLVDVVFKQAIMGVREGTVLDEDENVGEDLRGEAVDEGFDGCKYCNLRM